MAETPNHGYNVPDAGTQDWHEPVNENFEAFEVDIEIRDAGDPGANGYDPAEGAKYLDTATGEVYLAEGGSWSQEFSFGGGGGGGGIESLTGGEGINPPSIGDGDTVSVTWGDASVLDTNGAVADWSGAADLDASGAVTADFIGNLSGGEGIDPGTIGDGDTLSVAWADAADLGSNGGITDFSGATDLASDGSVDQLSGALTGGQALTDIAGTNLSIDSSGQLNASGGSGGGISSLTGGEGISPDSIGDGDTLSVASGDLAGPFLSTDGSNNLTVDAAGGLENDGSGALQAALGNALGFDGSNQIALTTDSLTVAGNPVSLGGSTDIGHTDLTGVSADQHHGKDHDHTEADITAVPNAGLANSSVTVSGGNGIKNGGSVSLGSSTTLDVEPSGVAGNALEDDGSDNLAVSAGGIGTSELSTPFADLATLFGDPISTGGTLQSSGALTVNTDGANGGSRVLELGIPGSDSNGNTAGANVLAGSASNSINGSAVGAVVAGGGSDADANSVTDNYGTVGGGSGNQAGSADGDATTATHATVGGGEGNEASGSFSTVGGGRFNTASGEDATIGGGENNTASGDEAIVPGGSGCEASGTLSFAAGNGAVAQHSGAFVWADSSVSPFKSTGDKQFLVDADGGTGIGTNDPVTTFHVQDSVAESGGENLGRHVAAIENTSSSSSPVPDVLGLELTNVTDPDEFNSYISFMDSTGTIGNIQGDGNGGVEFTGSTADFAEFFPKADPDREFADGTVVGLDDGEVVALDAESDPDTVLVVSTAPLVAGNRPIDEGERDAYVKLSLVGQVPVRVSASVGHGDVLVADDDGTAVARADCDEAGRPVVGMALAEAEAGEEVLALIGGPGIDTTPASEAGPETPGHESADGSEHARKARVDQLETELDEKSERIETLEAERGEREERIDDLEAENERLRERNADLEARLAAVEDHLGLGDSGTTAQGVADD